MESLLAALETTPLAAALRGSVWLYPLVNAAHIVGIALLFGAVTPLDLRLLGLWPQVPVAVLSRVLTPVAVAGLMLALPAGALLFMARAGEYLDSPLFQAKMLVVATALVNALALRWRWSPARAAAPSPGVVASAVLSLSLWAGAIVLGRLIGYF
jgi:hypothetical protein